MTVADATAEVDRLRPGTGASEIDNLLKDRNLRWQLAEAPWWSPRPAGRRA
jgi:hypothetical protein